MKKMPGLAQFKKSLNSTVSLSSASQPKPNQLLCEWGGEIYKYCS